MGVDQFVVEGLAHVLQRDLRVRDTPQGGLASDELRVKAGHTLFDHVPTDVAIVTPRPDNDMVGDRCAADPALVAVEHILVAVTPRASLEVAHVATVVRLGKSECADLLPASHSWKEP